jgi:hypothetical protein
MDYDVLKRLIAALEAEGVSYAVFGAVAMNLHGIGRFTEDLDLFVAPDASNIERLKRALKSVVDDPDLDTLRVDEFLGPYPAIEYVPPDGSLHVDIVTRLGDAFAFADLEVERLPLDELTVAVVTPRTLYRMKKDTLRLKDRADAEMLRRRFGLEQD